jgi:hypothetical protein
MNEDIKRLVIGAFLEGIDAQGMHGDLNLILGEEKEFTPITAWDRSRSKAALIKLTDEPASATAVEVTEELVRTAMAKAFGVDAICQPGWTPQKAMYQALAAGLGKGRSS